jgi:hypothetical protein
MILLLLLNLLIKKYPFNIGFEWYKNSFMILQAGNEFNLIILSYPALIKYSIKSVFILYINSKKLTF